MREQKLKDKIWHGMAICTFILLSIIVVVTAFWQLFPYKTADIVEPINILNESNQIAPEEKIIMELRITKYNLFPVTTNNSILCDNGRIYTIDSTMPNGKASLPVGIFTRVQDAYSLPGDIDIGSICHFEFQNTYEVNPIRKIIKTWKSEDFTVKEK
jgi:hypothetical protein